MKSLYWFLGIVAVALLLVFALNTYIYNEKQGEVVDFQDGRQLGFVYAFVDNNTGADFDDALWLTGKDAEDAAIQKGICTEATRAECLPNDYFIENTNESTVRIAISPEVKIIMQTWNMEETGRVEPVEISLEEFAPKINSEEFHWHHLPYYITVKDNVVVLIEEVYIP
jgi:hypothetical protein